MINALLFELRMIWFQPSSPAETGFALGSGLWPACARSYGGFNHRPF
jgi:hypothetical protein